MIIKVGPLPRFSDNMHFYADTGASCLCSLKLQVQAARMNIAGTVAIVRATHNFITLCLGELGP